MKTLIKVLLVIGMLINIYLLIKNISKRLKTEKGKADWEFGKKNILWNSMVGVLVNFFDTFGLGSFATSSFLFKIHHSVHDIDVPGTLNVGNSIPVSLQALIFLSLVNVDVTTLLCFIVSAVVGAFFGVRLVTKWEKRTIRLGMGIGLLLLGVFMIFSNLHIIPVNLTGTSLKLTGYKLVIAMIINFFLGAFMNLAVGLYAPCMALVSVLGMEVKAAFPIMMNSSAFLMSYGNGPRFIKEERYDMLASICQMVAGSIGVILAAFVINKLPIFILTWIFACVVLYSSFLYLRDGYTKK